MFDFLRYKKTRFEAGGFVLTETTFSREARKILRTYEKAPKFQAPRKIDSRDMCLRSSNQGKYPHCAGYATAGFLEVYNWKKLHYPEQVDGDAIYKKAKEVDGWDGNGTFLWSAVRAAQLLSLINGEGKVVGPDRDNIKFALHEYGVCIAGLEITEDWNYVDKRTGFIRDSGPSSKKLGGACNTANWL